MVLRETPEGDCSGGPNRTRFTTGSVRVGKQELEVIFETVEIAEDENQERAKRLARQVIRAVEEYKKRRSNRVKKEAP